MRLGRWMLALVALAACGGSSPPGGGDDDDGDGDGGAAHDGGDGDGGGGVPAAARLDVVRYTLAIEVDADGLGFAGLATLDVLIAAPQAAYELDLAAAVEVLETSGLATASARSGDRLVLLPVAPPAAGPAQVVVRYRGALAALPGAPADACPDGFGGLMRTTSRPGGALMLAFDWPNRARAWFPGNHHPSDGAAVDLSLTVAGELEVAGVGALIEAVDLGGGRRRWRFVEERAVPTYAVQLAAYPYTAVDLGSPVGGPTLTALVYPEDTGPAAALTGTAAALTFLSDRLGPYPFAGYRVAEAPACGLALGGATTALVDEALLADAGAARAAVVRELARQWLGVAVRPAAWNEVWWSQALAAHLAALHGRATAGDAAFAAILSQAWRAAHTRDAAAATDRPLRPTSEGAPPTAVDAEAAKGLWVLESLRRVLGEEAYLAAVRAYAEAHVGAAATTAALQAACEAASGEDLDWFFDQFVSREGHPQLAGTFTQAFGAADVTITQLQTRGPAVYRIPVTFELRGSSGTFTRGLVYLDQSPQTVTIAVGFPPVALVLDPDEQLYLDVACTAAADCPAGRACGADGFCER